MLRHGRYVHAFKPFPKDINILSDIANQSIPPVRHHNNRRRKPLLLLLQLDSAIRPGLSETDFRSLFGKCRCGLIMTRNAFGAHYCPIEGVAAEPEVIELTDTDDEN
jgi:hypothetical protein